jgi:hypothetical protein
MSKDGKHFTKDGAPVPNLQRLFATFEIESTTVKHLQGGAPVPTLQRVETAPGERGATVPTMQPVTQSTQTDRQSQGTQETNSAGNKK